MNIPIYRAKRKDNGEWAEVYLTELWADLGDERRFAIDQCETFDNNEYSLNVFEILPETLAIHFPDMLDKNGKRIFASLNESGIGGSIITASRYPFVNEGIHNYDAVVVMIYNSVQYVYRQISDNVRGASDGINNHFDEDYSDFEVTGIYKG